MLALCHCKGGRGNEKVEKGVRALKASSSPPLQESREQAAAALHSSSSGELLLMR